MKIIAITQARIGSSRLSGKVLKTVGNTSLLALHLKRLKGSKSLDKIIVATTNEEGSERICKIASSENIDCFKGSTEDVLDRYYSAAKKEKPDFVVRVTSDCPLIDPRLIDEVVQAGIRGGYDYYSNVITEDFPDGQDIELFTFHALETAWSEAVKKSDREHVTSYIRNNSSALGGKLFTSADHKCSDNYNHVRMTVDEQVDLDSIIWLVDKLGTEKDWLTYTKFILDNLERIKNTGIQRNEGYLKSIKNEEA